VITQPLPSDVTQPCALSNPKSSSQHHRWAIVGTFNFTNNSQQKEQSISHVQTRRIQTKMVVLDLIALAGFPVALSTIEGARHQKSKERSLHDEDQLRLRDFNLEVYCDGESRKRDQVHGASVILRDGRVSLGPLMHGVLNVKLYLSKPNDFKSSRKSQQLPDHLFKGFYLTIQPPPASASASHSSSSIWQSSSARASASMNFSFERLNKPTPIMGLVSTIPPNDCSPSSAHTSQAKGKNPEQRQKLNWIFVDPQTSQLRYGPHSESLLSHNMLLGPWNWTASEGDSGLTFEGWEGFVAVEESADIWAIYYDRDDNLLRNRKMVGGRRVLRISLERRIVDDEETDDEQTDHETTAKNHAFEDEWEIEEVE
jgi:hypothetical protein